MTRLFFLLWGVFACELAAQYQKSDLIVSPEGRKGTIHLYRFSDEQTSIKIIPRGKHANLGAAMKANQCFAGCNGGFFDPKNQPLGEVIAGGKKSGRKNLASPLTSGVIYQENKKLAVERSKSFYAKKKDPEQLLQTGPFLVENRQPVKGLSTRKFSRRTIIATDGKGNWLIAYTPPTTLAQLAKSLSTSGKSFGFEIETALNLDGGSSSALWVGRGHSNNPLYLREFKPVANYIGLVRK